MLRFENRVGDAEVDDGDESVETQHQIVRRNVAVHEMQGRPAGGVHQIMGVTQGEEGFVDDVQRQ